MLFRKKPFQQVSQAVRSILLRKAFYIIQYICYKNLHKLTKSTHKLSQPFLCILYNRKNHIVYSALNFVVMLYEIGRFHQSSTSSSQIFHPFLHLVCPRKEYIHTHLAKKEKTCKTGRNSRRFCKLIILLLSKSHAARSVTDPPPGSSSTHRSSP